MSDTSTPNPATLTLADLKAGDPPPKNHYNAGRPPGLMAKFKDLLREAPGVWYEYPILTRSGVGQSNNNTEGYEWTTRSETNGNGKKVVRVYGRFVG